MENESKINFIPMQIPGVFGIKTQAKLDDRGTFTRIWELNSLLSDFKIVQASIVMNPISRTLRGLHFQEDPFAENKVIQCISGKVFDVVVDMRKESASYGEYLGLEIGPSSFYQGIFVPERFAHGYLTLEPYSNLTYFMDNFYSPKHSSGLLWNDHNLAIDWPTKPALISNQDLNWPKLII